MASSSRHEVLRKVAREYLKMHYGFKEEELVEEYPVKRGDGTWLVDVAGISKNHRVAAEVGDVSIYKLLGLAEHFNDVVWIPYWVNVVTGEEAVEAQVNRRVSQELHRKKTEEGRQLLEERSKHGDTIETLERVLWVVLTKVQDPTIKAEVSKMIKGHGLFEAKRFSPAGLRNRARENIQERPEDPGESPN